VQPADPVVRLGMRPPAIGRPWFYGYRILQGQTLHLRYISNVAATLRAWARVIYDDGTEQLLTVPDEVIGNDRTSSDAPRGEVANHDGWVVGAAVEMDTDGVVRGQTYVKLVLEPFGTVLCADYCYSTFGQVTLGVNVPPGPAGGAGHIHTHTIKANGAPGTNTYSPGLSATIIAIHNFYWYYHCSADVATRTLESGIRNPGGALPTGYDLDNARDVYRSSDLVLTANQDGVVFCDPKRAGINDNGTYSVVSTATLPSPFLPGGIVVNPDDNITFFFAALLAEALDFEAVYALVEEWVVLG